MGVNGSVLFIVAFVVWELSDLVLPDYVAGRPATEHWIVGSVATVLLFFTLLLPETSHAVVAEREGVGVRRITPWLFGGVSELEGEALSPGADFRIAVVGPLTSFVLAGAFWLITLTLQP
ncbi:MAG TPA: site-2 protease family protein, partial [Acidimicrobiales bacterium]|nr:site-2 protease family protein [Acidimicrobiales bacterium]